MGFWDKVMEIGGEMAIKAKQDHARRMGQVVKQAKAEGKKEPTIGGKTLGEWDRSWEHLGVLDSASLSHLSSSVGLYRAKLRGKVVYIGRAVEHSNGGLRKRLSDYTRSSNSSRKHTSGQLMNEHASQLVIDVLITGSNENAASVARKLESYFIGKYSPDWNKMLK